MAGDLLVLVFKNLKRRRLRSWLTMIGIFIGIAAVVSLISLGEGLSEVVKGQFDLLGTEVLFVQASRPIGGPPGAGVVDPLLKRNVDAIERLSDVELTLGRIIEGARIEFNDALYFGYVGSIPNGKNGEILLDLLNYEAEQGRVINGYDSKKIIVGHDFTDEERFGKPVRIGSKMIVGEDTFEVVGIIKKRGSFIVDNTILMVEDDMRDSLNIPDEEYDAILVKAKTGVSIPDLKITVEKVMRDERDVKVGEENFEVQSNQSAIESLDSTLFGVQLFVYIIALISIVVGGIGIANTMYTSVLERTDEIGIMKAIGAKNIKIFNIFFLESGLLGTIGGIIGIILGIGIAKLAEFAGSQALGTDLLSAQVPAWLIIGALLFSFIIGTTSGLLPAYKASKLQPVEALRD